jgi:mannosyltransferase
MVTYVAMKTPTYLPRLPFSIIPLLLLFIIWAIYLFSIRLTHMHTDEYLVYYQTRATLADAFQHQTYQDVHPPLWFTFFWFWRQFVGISEFAGRMQAILFSMITLSLVYRIGRDWFGARRYGVLAMALLGVSSYHVAYALEIRPYALTMLLAALSMLCFGRWLRLRERRWALAWGAVAGLMLYVHYFTAFLSIAQAIYLLVAVRPTRRVLTQFAQAVLVGAAIWLPWLPFFIGQVTLLRSVANAEALGYASGLGTSQTTALTSPETISRFVMLLTNGAPLVYALLLGLGILLLGRKGKWWLALTWALGVPTLALLVNLVAAVFTPRYYAHVTPGLALAAGAGLARLSQLPRFSRLAWTLGAAAVVVLGIQLPSTLPNRPPLRDIYQTLSRQSAADAAVYMSAATRGDGWSDWQMQQYLSPALYNNQLASLESPLPRNIWYLSAAWFDDDVQAEFRALEQTHPLQTVLGDCNRQWCFLAQLMQAPPNNRPQVFGDGIGFYGVDIDHAAADGITARLWWRADAPIPLDYSIGAQLLDTSGALVAQSDGAINHYGSEIVQTSGMQAGQIYIDHRTLTPAAPLPDGDYQLMIVIYQSWDGTRLTLPDGSDSIIAAEVTIP